MKKDILKSGLALTVCCFLWGSTLFSQEPKSDTCTCSVLSLEEARDSAELVFFGEVIAAETNWQKGGVKYSFRVNASWKQSVPQVIFVQSDWEKKCGSLFREGERYLVFGMKTFSAWGTNRCFPNLGWPVDTAVVNLLGQSLPPDEHQASRRSFGLLIATLGGASMLFFLFLLGRAWIRRKKD
ncbi:MAG: hypothetical protein R3B47_04460 [Bacteroidia bacterium]